ncbi:hypothetical protein Anas_05867 [Armadillidium nasatum]|uniref:Uncharacterized protein n=1 Tax=Armadillidium nasatum TaxID=96803 RepID=A0A5N5SRH0_9CRUS|nr:hypothetical protein Anas_05867 [Armadillidium nasatum]
MLQRFSSFHLNYCLDGEGCCVSCFTDQSVILSDNYIFAIGVIVILFSIINAGIIFSNGGHWLHNRRFLLRHLRDLGMGKSKMEGIIMREVEGLIEIFKTLTKEPSKLPLSINIAVLNILMGTCCKYVCIIILYIIFNYFIYFI